MSSIHDQLNIKVPIWSAGMGLGIAGAALTGAVSNAGGLGVLGLGSMAPDDMRATIEATRKLTSRAFGANIIMPMMIDGQMSVCFDEKVPLLVLFWGDASPYIKDAHRRGMLVVSQCGEVEEAVKAAEAGVDGVIVQGIEAGGHVKAVRPLGDVIPEAVAELGKIPVIASGGIATGDDIAAALAMGASAVSMGTRFLATQESVVLESYKQRVVEATSNDTVFTKLFDLGWPDAAHRVIRNRAYSDWETAGEPPTGQRPNEGAVIGSLGDGDDATELPRYSVTPPLINYHGELEEAALYCGKSCDRITDVPAASELMDQLIDELKAAI